MKERIESLISEAKEKKIGNLEELESFRIEFLGRQGILKSLREDFKQVPGPEKRDVGIALNLLKDSIESRIESVKLSLSKSETATSSGEDFTRPHGEVPIGSRHPISLVRKEILDIFARIGFTVSQGPEIEDDWHVFSGLNFPPEHPARDMQDTFFIEKDPDIMLRTHTSSVQVREMETKSPPLRIVGADFPNNSLCLWEIHHIYIRN